jgi:hypothetical protein
VTVERVMKEVEAAARHDRRERMAAGGAAGYSDPERSQVDAAAPRRRAQ